MTWEELRAVKDHQDYDSYHVIFHPPLSWALRRRAKRADAT